MDDYQLYTVVGFGIAAFLGLLIHADATRRYGRGRGFPWALGTFLVAIVVVPAYVIYRAGHPPVPARLQLQRDLAELDRMWYQRLLGESDYLQRKADIERAYADRIAIEQPPS